MRHYTDYSVLKEIEKPKPPSPMRQDHDGTWLFTDLYGHVWRLTQTHEPTAPFTISIVSRGLPRS